MSFPLTRELPPIGTHETDTLDFKADDARKSPDAAEQRQEFAKDVAAMANTSGGTILVGACGGSAVARYQAIDEVRAKAIGRGYEEAVRDRCRPPPLVGVELLPNGGGSVLAVHIPPHAWPVAVKYDTSGLDQGGWAFFRRVASQTKEILPDMLPMMTPECRRASILLRAIPADADVSVVRTNANPGSGATPLGVGKITAVDDDANAFTFHWNSGAGMVDRNFAIDMVRTVYRGFSGRWYVDLQPYNDVN